MHNLGAVATLLELPPRPHLVGSHGLAGIGLFAPAILHGPSVWNTSGVTFLTSAATITCLLPSDLQAGAMLVAYCAIVGSGKTFSVSSPWTLGDTAADGAACWAWKYVDGTETNAVFSWSGAVACNTEIIQIIDVKSTGAVGAASKASGSGTSISVAGIVTASDLSMALSIMTAQTSQFIPDPSGYENEDQFASTRGSSTLSTKIVPTVSSSGAAAATITSAAWEAFLIEIERA